MQYNYPYIDLVPAFSGLDGRLPTQYTRDGLHLNNAGYQLWREQIKPIIWGYPGMTAALSINLLKTQLPILRGEKTGALKI